MPEEKNWKDDLDEDLRDASELQDIKSVGDLGKSYVNMSKAYSSRVESLKGDEDEEKFYEKAGKFLRIPEKAEDYDLDVKENQESLKALGHKYKLHPKQVKGFAEDYLKVLKKNDENTIKEKVKGFDSKNKEFFKDIKDKDTMISKGLNKSGFDVDEFKKEMGHNFSNSKVQRLLYDYGKSLSGGKKTSEDTTPPVTTGEASTSERQTMREKYKFVMGQIHGQNTAFHDENNEKHVETRKKVERYTKELGEWAKKTGEEISFH